MLSQCHRAVTADPWCNACFKSPVSCILQVSATHSVCSDSSCDEWKDASYPHQRSMSTRATLILIMVSYLHLKAFCVEGSSCVEAPAHVIRSTRSPAANIVDTASVLWLNHTSTLCHLHQSGSSYHHKAAVHMKAAVLHAACHWLFYIAAAWKLPPIGWL